MAPAKFRSMTARPSPHGDRSATPSKQNCREYPLGGRIGNQFVTWRMFISERSTSYDSCARQRTPGIPSRTFPFTRASSGTLQSCMSSQSNWRVGANTERPTIVPRCSHRASRTGLSAESPGSRAGDNPECLPLNSPAHTSVSSFRCI
jgi:hypothetical protein